MTVLADLAEDLLVLAVDALDEAGLPPADRVSTWAGQPPWELGDCTAVTVSLTVGNATGTETAGFPADAGGSVVRGAVSLAAEFAVTYLMCSPQMGDQGEPPEPEVQMAAARVFHGACWAVWCASVAFARSQQGVRDVALRGLAVVGAEGGQVAVTSRIAVEV